jgi:hypothetical protein
MDEDAREAALATPRRLASLQDFLEEYLKVAPRDLVIG